MTRARTFRLAWSCGFTLSTAAAGGCRTQDREAEGAGSSGGIALGTTAGAAESGDVPPTPIPEPTDDSFTGGGAEGGESCVPVPTDATVTGTVYAPNLEIPISGALVYVTHQAPESVPDGVYCAECVEVPCQSQFVLTEPDGTFELPAVAAPGQKLVVQKGQFLHVRDIDIAPGVNMVAAEDSNLPGSWDPAAGEWIPRIAVVQTSNDSIYNVLAKIGMGDVDQFGELARGSESFDLLDQPQGGDLLDDLEKMRKYHIIFVPCMAQDGMGNLGTQRMDNIRQWVAEGGKFYVTDWANEYLYETFPAYQTLHQQEFNPDLPLYHTTGTVLDEQLLAWLEALPPQLKDIGGGHPNLLSLPQVQLLDNWSGVETIPPVMVDDGMGNQVDVGHHTWVEGPCRTCFDSSQPRPMTISASYGCGRMMFSTYHTDEGSHAGLTPQELVLLYIILEIGVCHEVAPPPPPPVG